MSALYQLSASHSSVVIMKMCSKEVAEMQASMLSILENLLHSYMWICAIHSFVPFTFCIFCVIYILYLAVLQFVTSVMCISWFSGLYNTHIRIFNTIHITQKKILGSKLSLFRLYLECMFMLDFNSFYLFFFFVFSFLIKALHSNYLTYWFHSSHWGKIIKIIWNVHTTITGKQRVSSIWFMFFFSCKCLSPSFSPLLIYIPVMAVQNNRMP